MFENSEDNTRTILHIDKLNLYHKFPLEEKFIEV